jgi:hypothetical protein
MDVHSMMTNQRTKENLSITADIKVINAIEELKNNTKYANRSSIANELLIIGLEAKGIKIEALRS